MRFFFRLIPVISLFGLLTVFGIGINRQANSLPDPSSLAPANPESNRAPAVLETSQRDSGPSVNSVRELVAIPKNDLPVTENISTSVSDNQKVNSAPSVNLSRLPVFLQNFAKDWNLEESGGCVEVWDFTPGLSKIPAWLHTPETADGLKTTNAYYILAGMLIRNKVVDASSCPSGGLTTLTGDNLAANNCGMNLALPTVITWQNRFNQKIYDVSQRSGIPAVLLKNVFRQESQFWPGVFIMETEGGLGQMTTIGSDALLMWSNSLFENICNKSFNSDVCDRGYTHLNVAEKAILQGALFQLVNASCAECSGGIDLDQADYSVSVFAENLLSNCKQTGALVDEIAAVKYPSLVSTYTDLWKMTLFNYNAGSGCLERAVRRTWKQDPNTLLTWDRVVAQVDSECIGGIDYVSEIAK